ncbi:MAG: twin arginine-targeting protein translocase TatC [Bacteroidetes bacterium GWF2_42_66]|nr:MAG: twin arginine-targeting protein translocase TatC [Bacteroidetes bacterium GWA2_42_15]OFY01973.1 MAG: twin arginine-targeting protein translocase TatC [Bacteroidetes bacterium GWE2_42_39]OFY44973.1 MAG: twin arginine-targeting protein translocase TatC [Bacteroidetes bacterium GWF2_42_66]HCR90211.1 twin-arginine translocase subunit TatC [Prolixibacteraceae bacterium]
MSFLEHLEVLRWHIVRSFAAILVFAILAFIFSDFIFDAIILKPRSVDFWTNRMFAIAADYFGMESLRINTTPLSLISISMSGQFSADMTISLITGLIVASPYVIYEFWSFMKPALYDNERKHARGAAFYMSVLFVMGVLFGYYLIVPLSIDFLGSYSVSAEVTNQIYMISYISTVASICLASGVVFELPIFIFFLSKVGLISPEFLRKYRKHAYIVLLILAAIITPPDIFSQVLVCIPLVILYEVSIVVSKHVVKRAEREMAAS